MEVSTSYNDTLMNSLSLSPTGKPWDVIIIGGGAGGAAAALSLQGLQVLMLDVGETPSHSSGWTEPLAVMRKEDRNLQSFLLGNEFESAWGLKGEKLSPKLKAPLMRYLLKRPHPLPFDIEQGFSAVQSFAKGGLANAWGAGVYRYNENDLKGFPISASSLEPYYDRLTDHIGISGVEHDDLSWYLGSSRGLQKPYPLSPLCNRFFERYTKRSSSLTQKGVFVGKVRGAILTEPHRGRAPFRAFGHDFFSAPHEGIYSPAFTIDELVQDRKLVYRSGTLVQWFKEHDEDIKVHAINLTDKSPCWFSCRTLILAAGAINSARIVLTSRRDYETRLPLLDNPVTFLPFIDIGMIGGTFPPEHFIGGELLLLHQTEDPARPVQGSIYALGGPLRTDLLQEFPLPLKGSLAASRYLLPALLMAQLFYPDEPRSDCFLQLQPAGSLLLNYGSRNHVPYESQIATVLRRMGYLALARWAVFPPAGSSIHYAGTLPMKANPRTPYETDAEGKLSDTRGIFVTDASTFPNLPAKNHTFTLMANACRIAEGIRKKFALLSETTRENCNEAA